MSFANTHLSLPGSPIQTRDTHQFKLCAKCEEKKPPEGGIDMSPAKWICASCWVIRQTRRYKV